MPYKFSPSSLELLKECPRCFWLHFKKGVQRPRGIFPSLPGGMDVILKTHFDSFREQGELPPELRQVDGASLFDDMERLKVWRNNFKGLGWKDAEGNALNGAIDDVLVKGKKMIILDFKTRGFPLKEDTAAFYQEKLDLYAFLFEKNGYPVEEYAYLLFYYPKHVLLNGDVAFHTELVKMKVSTRNAGDILKRALAVLAGQIPSGPVKVCAYCAWAEKAYEARLAAPQVEKS